MENDLLRKLVEEKIAAGDVTPDWIMALVAMRTLTVLQNIDQRLEAIDEALAPTAKGRSIAGDIATELRTLGRLFQRASNSSPTRQQACGASSRNRCRCQWRSQSPRCTRLWPLPNAGCARAPSNYSLCTWKKCAW